jgi:hypothetical protein
VGENLKAALVAAGATLNDLVKTDHVCHRH